MKATVFLGGGRITGALASGLRLAEVKSSKDEDEKAAREIVVYDRHREKVLALRFESQVEIARDLKSAVERADMLIVAVRPGSVRGMLAEVGACGAEPPKLCVSLAAGIPLANLREWMGPPVQWSRAMPSPVCRVGRGFTPICFDQSVAVRDCVRISSLFNQVGQVLDLPEEQMDAITATASPTNGYHALAALVKAAQRAGLNRPAAQMAAAHALSGGIEYWRKSTQSLDELLEEAATPGGIAAATMAAMDESGYGRAVANGIRAGVKQARKNARVGSRK